MTSIAVTIAVDDATTALESYDQIQVHRSTAGVGGPYEDITADTPSEAYIAGTIDAPFTLNGLDLTIRIDGGANQTATIEEADPVYIDPLVDELAGKFTDVTVSNGGTGNLLFTSNRTGTQSIVEIVGGTALTALGLTAGDKVTGKDRRLLIQENYTEFTFVDNGGDTSYYYKIRYYNSDTGVTSDFSDAIPAEQVSPLSANLITAEVDMVGLDGVPLGNRTITISNVYNPNYMVVSTYGVFGNVVELTTDASGHGEIDLVMGSTVDVSISGTGITRRISVPTSGTSFNLLASVAAADDIFQIQTPNIPNAIRRS